MNKVLVYRFGDSIEVFANAKAANEWFEKNDPEGVALEYDVIGAPTAKDAFNDIRADLAAMQPRDARALDVVEKCLAALEKAVPEEEFNLSNYDHETVCRIARMQFDCAQIVAEALATARQYINEMKG